MDAERWRRAQAVFHEALDLPAPERPAHVRRACGDDAALADLVLQLIEEDATPGSLLDAGVAGLAHAVLAGTGAAAPRRIGRYDVYERLGEGGMGVVFLGGREDLGSRVAIKILRDAWVSPSRRDRFRAEQRTLARLSHPSIARIFDADTLEDATPWFAMEFVEGESITAHCERTGAPLAERLRLFRQVCDAVRYAHQQLVVHRDLKPSNILVSRDGDVKLLDFGIAKQLEAEDASGDRTRTMLRLMTPAYAAPEQIRGEPGSVQTDVYALGVLLYELVAGVRPFDMAACTAAEAEQIVLTREPEKPSSAAAPARRHTAGRAVWADLDVLTLAAMHKDPERRYASVDALIRDLDNLREGRPLDARPDSKAYRARKFVIRHRAGLTAAAAVVLIIAAVVAFYSTRLNRALAAARAETARTERIERFMLDLFEGGDAAAGPAADMRVVSLLERGSREAASLDAMPAVQAELYETLGSIHQRLGSHDEADTHLRAALDRRRGALGPEHPDVARSLVALGLLRLEQAQLAEAESLVREGLDLARRVAPDDPVLPEAIAALGKVLREQGHYDAAVPHLEDAIARYSATPSHEAELATTMTALANTHYYAGRMDDSERLNRQVIEIDRRIYGPRHPNVAHDLLNLGAVETSRARHAEAAALYTEALGILEAWYGRGHPETASAITILGQSYVRLDKFDEGRALFEEALGAQEKNYGPVHPRVALIYNELALLAHRQDRLAEAETNFARALEIYREIYGRHARVGIALSNLASVHLSAGAYDKAEALFREALALYGELLPPNHVNNGITRGKLGRALLRQGRIPEAENELLAAQEILSSHEGTSSWLETTRADLGAIRSRN